MVLSANTPSDGAATTTVATAVPQAAPGGSALDMAPTPPIRGLGAALFEMVMRSTPVPAHVLGARSPTKERLPNHHVKGEPTRLGVQVPEPPCLRRDQRQARKVEIFGSNPLNTIRKCCSVSDRDRSIQAITIES